MNSTILELAEQDSAYGYRPTLHVCAIFIGLFSITALAHLDQMQLSRFWFMGPTVLLAACLEILGWAGRLWSNKNLFLDTPFTIQICTLIIAPTPLLAANFVVFGRLVALLGTEFSRLPPKFYARIFLGCDIISLLLQAAGGGLASSPGLGDSGLTSGTNLMIAGIALQVAMMIVFAILVVEYVLRYFRGKPLSGKVASRSGAPHAPLESFQGRMFLFALGSTTGLLFVRGVYRLVELSGGWGSRIMHTEWAFNVFDASMVFLAFAVWNAIHPARFLQGGVKRRRYAEAVLELKEGEVEA